MSGLSVFHCEPAVSKSASAVFWCTQQHWWCLCVCPGITLYQTLQYRVWTTLSPKYDSKKLTAMTLYITVTWYCSACSKKNSSNRKDHRFSPKFFLIFSKVKHHFPGEDTTLFQTPGGLSLPREFTCLWVTWMCPFSLSRVNSFRHYLLPQDTNICFHLLSPKHQKTEMFLFTHIL